MTTRTPAARASRIPRAGRFAWGLAIIAVPLLLALLGPLFAGEPGPRAVSFTLGDGHWLGTDFVGRDVWRQVLLGGRTVVVTALAATALAYLVALPVGLVAALTHLRRLEDVLMRPLDVLLAVPSLLLILLVASVFSPGAVGLALLVAAVNVPDAARIVRTAAGEVAARPAVEALRMQGESWGRIAFGHVGRATVRTLAADAGVRLTGVLYLVSTAAFLGVGVAPDAADWAVMVDRNRTGLVVQPWAVVVPAVLIVALTTGTNLLFDAVGPGRRESASPSSPGAPTRRSSTCVAGLRRLRVEVRGRVIVDGVDLCVLPGKVTALVGASGSGKTTTGLALLGEFPPGARVTGEVYRAADGPVGYVPQHPAAVLNPARRISALLHDIARARVRHLPRGRRRAAARARVLEALADAQLPDAEALLRRYPHQLSGGQQQRVVLAQALLLGARVIVADEPTTGQDPLTRSRIVEQLAAVAARGIAVVLLSHDLDVVRALADDVLVMRAGRVVESGPPERLWRAPRHAWTRRLLDEHRADPPEAGGGRPVLEIRDLTAAHGKATVLRAPLLTLDSGECLAVVGRSGSGKTTLARCLAGLHRDHGGEVLLDGTPLPRTLRRRSSAQLAAVQYVFQDARAAFDEYRPVLDQVARTAVRLRGSGEQEAREEALATLVRLGLPADDLPYRLPGRLSGGELQRVALARALLARPRVLICDEITSGLDMVTRRGILDLLAGLLREREGLSLVLITHDQDTARIAHRVAVVDGGELVTVRKSRRLTTP
ncbi:ABC-type glutathione transport system ATPase component/ABC-type dipeptide/oligopeptide/nickel transport system permease subunit [Streptomyces sp. SAI-126]|nr:ABC-type glutathione transport system ATPase component/ABC-type dipeptide/oligopeptide/nickel transport system permease subunit [Streptomyces sp. SAI-119]MDH6495825.1 ABC-type glutathione transport system ATPase component/ABC-type dipeptide/oligopeptide/nickel transport system permease subunit [Streptomyces sp. SAI-149]